MILFSFLLLWYLSAWRALINLSGGRVRRIEIKDKELAKKIEEWLEHKYAYETVFSFIVFIFIVALSLVSFDYSSSVMPPDSAYRFPAVGAAVFLLIVLLEFISEAAVLKIDIQILNLTMPLIRFLRFTLFFPVVFGMKILKDQIEQINQQEDDEDRATTEDEILSLVEQDETDGEDASLEEDEKRMIRGVFDLDNTYVREIMTPRVDIIGISMDASSDHAVKLFIESGHSRIPLYEENIDNIKGILYAKDFLNKHNTEGRRLAEVARAPIFIPETKEVGDLLREIQKTRNHFSVVIDEYGGTAGIITLEDIIEEIVGEIRDEYDTNEADTPMHKELKDGSVVFDARTLINDVNEILDSDISEDEDVDTIGGFVCGELGHIPAEGEELRLDKCGLLIKVLKADKKKILKLKIIKLDDKEN